MMLMMTSKSIQVAMEVLHDLCDEVITSDWFRVCHKGSYAEVATWFEGEAFSFQVAMDWRGQEQDCSQYAAVWYHPLEYLCPGASVPDPWGYHRRSFFPRRMWKIHFMCVWCKCPCKCCLFISLMWCNSKGVHRKLWRVLSYDNFFFLIWWGVLQHSKAQLIFTLKQYQWFYKLNLLFNKWRQLKVSSSCDESQNFFPTNRSA